MMHSYFLKSMINDGEVLPLKSACTLSNKNKIRITFNIYFMVL